jgi:putative polyhydroxyalkanoate system protein
MPTIDIRRKHAKNLKDAKAAVDAVAKEISQKFELTYGWDGNHLHFERAGVNGRIALEKDTVHVTADLGFLLSMLKPAVEKEIEKRLDQHFGVA